MKTRESHSCCLQKYIQYIHNQSSCCLLIALLSYTDILWLFFLFVGFPRALCTLYSPNLNALLYQTVRKRKIQKKYFLYFKYKIHVLYFVTFSGTSILYFILIHLFEGYFVFCIKTHFDVFLPISDYYAVSSVEWSLVCVCFVLITLQWVCVIQWKYLRYGVGVYVFGWPHECVC